MIFLSGVPVECVLCVLWHLIPILLKPKLDDYFDILLDKIKKKQVNGDSECLELQRRLSSNCCKLERKKSATLAGVRPPIASKKNHQMIIGRKVRHCIAY